MGAGLSRAELDLERIVVGRPPLPAFGGREQGSPPKPLTRMALMEVELIGQQVSHMDVMEELVVSATGIERLIVVNGLGDTH